MIRFFRIPLFVAVMCFVFNAQAESVFQTKPLTLIETADESDSEIHELVIELSRVQGEPQVSRKIGGQILDLVSNKKDISSYDYLWTLYSLVLNGGPELDGGMSVKDYLEITDTALNFLDYNGVGDWVYTDEGQFKMEVYRQAANGAAWALRETQPKNALGYIELGLNHMREQDTWMQDTQVRILLNLNEQDKAYAIVKVVLEEDPDFGDFQDFPNNESYGEWLKAN